MTVARKVCILCGLEKPLDDYYTHPTAADGYLNRCKVCYREQVRQRALRNYERYGDLRRARTKTEHCRKQAVVLQRKARQGPQRYKHRARWALSNAIRDGRAERKPCEVCGKKAQAHHHDYSKPLDVRWLCFKHHRELEHGQRTSGVAV